MFKYTDIVVFKRQYTNQDIYQITWVSQCGEWLKVEGVEGRISSSLFEYAKEHEISAGHRIDLETLRNCDTSQIARNMKGEVI